MLSGRSHPGKGLVMNTDASFRRRENFATIGMVAREEKFYPCSVDVNG